MFITCSDRRLARWIEYARLARTQVEARHLATVRGNVLLQRENLRSYDPVREGERAGTLRLEGWVYPLETGEVEVYGAGAGAWAAVAFGEAE